MGGGSFLFQWRSESFLGTIGLAGLVTPLIVVPLDETPPGSLKEGRRKIKRRLG